MRKKIKLLVLLTCLLAVSCSIFGACGNQDDTQKGQLERPVISSISEDGVVVWSKVENANRYKVYINGDKFVTTMTTTFTVAATQAGDYSISVKACDSMGKFTESELSESKIYHIAKTKLATPVIELNEKLISWTGIAGATGYKIYINETLIENPLITQENGKYFYLFVQTEANVYSVSIVAFDSAEIFRESNASNKVSITIKDPDISTYWDSETIPLKWDGKNTAGAQGYFMTVGVGAEPASAENYVTLPADKKYFKVVFMRFSDEIANPNVFVYVKGASDIEYRLVRAMGAESDYVTTSGVNQSYMYAYDLSTYDGNATIKIAVESAEPSKAATACFQSMGFSDYGTEAHTTTKTDWSKGEIGLDWIFNNACGWVLEGENGLLSVYAEGYIENKIAVTQETNCLKIVAGAKLDIYVNGSAQAVACIQDGTTYSYDLTVYIGNTVTVRGIATALTQLVSLALVENNA